MAKRTSRTPAKEGEFLDELAETGNVTKASELSGVARRTIYDWRAANEDFRARWETALDLGCDALEDEATRRAHDGVEEPVYYQGEVVGQVQRYSDTLLMFLLKGRRPEKFKDRTELTGNDGAPIVPVLNVTINRAPESEPPGRGSTQDG